MRGLIIQKFGGTSLATQEAMAQAAEKVRSAAAAGLMPVVVVSAMGRRGAPYATDTLAELLTPEPGEEAERDRDLLLGCGEIISAVLFAARLRQLGLRAAAFTGAQAGIITDRAFGRGTCRAVRPRRLAEALRAGCIPVVTGFQGVSDRGELVTLGRGGSDTTAALLGSALRARRVEIYTDVEGVMTADPRTVAEAGVLEQISYGELFQLADQGARVIHPRAVEIAGRSGTDLVVRSTFTDGPGTRISRQGGGSGGPVRAVTSLEGRTQLLLPEAALEDQSRLLCTLGERGISVDLISLGPQGLAVTVDGARGEEAAAAAGEMGLPCRVRTGCARITAVGEGMRGRPGIMSRMLRSLLEAGISPLQSADSTMSLSCLVEGEQSARALRTLHRAFGLDGSHE